MSDWFDGFKAGQEIGRASQRLEDSREKLVRAAKRWQWMGYVLVALWVVVAVVYAWEAFA